MPAPFAQQRQTFAGFQSLDANYIYCPNQFLDVCLPHCSRGAVRLVAYILRQTLGWLDENGKPLTQDISIPYLNLQQRARISTRAIPAAIAEAESGGFIECVIPGAANADGQRGQTGCYKLRWNENGEYTTDPTGFQGFFAGEGHRSPIPNTYFDVVIPNETRAMCKVVGTVLRHTVGYQNQFGGRRSSAPLSFTYIQRYANIKDRVTLANTLQDAITKNFICRVAKGYFDPNAGRHSRAASYAVKWLHEAMDDSKTAKTLPGKLQRGKNPTESTAKNRPDEDGKNPTTIKTVQNNTSKQHDPSVAAENVDGFNLLRDAGFDEATARELSGSRGFDEIQRQIDWLDARNPHDNRLGMLRKAIEQNWSKPVTVARAEKTRRLAENARKQTARQEADDAEAVKSKHKQQRRRDAALVIFNRLSDDERTALENTVFEQLNSDFFRQRFRTNKPFRLQHCLDEMCHREGTVSTSPPVAA